MSRRICTSGWPGLPLRIVTLRTSPASPGAAMRSIMRFSTAAKAHWLTAASASAAGSMMTSAAPTRWASGRESNRRSSGQHASVTTMPASVTSPRRHSRSVKSPSSTTSPRTVISTK
ncbi:hypothetical protein NOLU111490_15915 [Novosphingobium lubricantis]